LGLRVELAGLNLAEFPERLAANCDQIADPAQYTPRMWIFGKAKDAASTYYILAGYAKWRNPEPGQRLFDVPDYGTMVTIRGNKCVSDDAGDAFGTPDPYDENDDTVPAPILRELARDLVVQTVRASGGPDRLRAEIKNQRIDFNALPPEIQRAFRPYFVIVK
jgi:hypothetical protein